MADDEKNEVQEDSAADEEYMGPGQEFRVLYDQGENLGSSLKQIAMTMQQAGERGAAEVLRTVAGDVIEWMLEVVAAAGAHLDSIDLRIEEGGDDGALDTEAAKAIYRTLYANNKLWEDVKSQATSTQVEVIDKQIEMNRESMQLLVDLSGDDDLPAQIEEEAAEAQSGSGTTN